jgi:hypothetical protein
MKSRMMLGFMKIEVEGHALAAPYGTPSLIDRCSLNVLIETKKRHTKRFGARAYEGCYMTRARLAPISAPQNERSLHPAERQPTVRASIRAALSGAPVVYA